MSHTLSSKEFQAEEELLSAYELIEHDFKQRTEEFANINLLLRQEINQRKAIERALAKSEARFQSFIQANVTGVVHAHLNGLIVDANDAFLNMVGYNRQALQDEKLSWRDMTPEEYHPLDLQAIQDGFTRGSIKPYEKQLICQDGSRIDVIVGISGPYSEEYGAAAYVIDITPRKEIERELQKTLDRERLVKRLIQVISQTFDINAILQHTANELGTYFKTDRCIVARYYQDETRDNIQLELSAQYTSSNDIVQEEEADLASLPVLRNINRESVNIQSSIRLQINAPDEIPEALKDFYNKYQVQSALVCEILYRDFNYGRICLHHCHHAHEWTQEEIAILDEVSTHVGIALYQTDLFQQMVKAKNDAEIANQRKNQFLANISHELRTPLHAIIGFSEILSSNDLSNLTERQHRYLHNIGVSGQHLLDLVNDLLDISKIESGYYKSNLESFDVHPAVTHCISMFQTFCQQKGIRLELQIDAKLQQITADPAQFRQILYNLIGNAIKYNHPNGSVLVKLFPTVADGKLWAICEISDTGIGIPQEEQQYIFDLFYQVDSSTTRSNDGAGLGLALTQKLVELHGGKILVSSRPDEGSVFTVMIPQQESVLCEEFSSE